MTLIHNILVTIIWIMAMAGVAQGGLFTLSLVPALLATSYAYMELWPIDFPDGLWTFE